MLKIWQFKIKSFYELTLRRFTISITHLRFVIHISFSIAKMNRKKRILQPNQSHNENNEGHINMPQHIGGTFDVQHHLSSTNICSNQVLDQTMLNTQIDDQSRKKGKSIVLDKSLNNKGLSYNYLPYTQLDHSVAHKQLPYNQYHFASHGSGTNMNMLVNQTPIRGSCYISSIPITCKSLNIKSCSCRKKYFSYFCIMFY